MSAVLIWIAALLTVTVIAEIVAFFVLNSKISKLKAEKYEAYRKKNGGTGLFSGAVVTFGLPDISLLILSVILAGECVFLTFEIIKSAKELKKLLAEANGAPAPQPVVKAKPAPAPAVVKPVGPTNDEEKLVADLVRETIEVTEAHSAIADEVAVHFVEDETVDVVKRYTKKSIVNVDSLSAAFESGEVVNLESLKGKGIIPKSSDYVKVLARGALDKQLTVEAQDFSVDAVKMIILTGGHAIKKS